MPTYIRFLREDSENEFCLCPKKFYKNDAGWDLFVSKDIVIKANTTKEVSTGIRIQIPNGFFGRITGRSSTLKNKNCLVNEGIIDAGFTGPLYISVKNMSEKQITIKAGTRLAQILIHRVEEVKWIEVTQLDSNLERNEKGFGSSGC